MDDEHQSNIQEMSPMQVDSFFNYAKALIEGKVDPPAGVTELGSTIEDVIEKMLLMKAVLRTSDYNSVDAVRVEFNLVNPLFSQAAFAYRPPQKYFM